MGLAALDENRANQREEREKPFFDFSSNVGPSEYTCCEIRLPLLVPRTTLVSWTPTLLPFQWTGQQEGTELLPDTRDTPWH